MNLDNKENINIKDIRKDFPYLKEGYIYLDTAATSQKPQTVIDKEIEYYTKYNGNPHSENMHYFSYKSTNILENGREEIAKFLGVKNEEIIFTKSASESLNIAILGLSEIVKSGDILITILEHHANLVPYQVLAKKNNLNLKMAYTNEEDYSFDYLDFENKITKDTRIIGLTACSNVSGEDLDIDKIYKIIDKKAEEFKKDNPEYIYPYIILDISQSINHEKINLSKYNIYASAFSGHKMYGPQGIGVLYLNENMIDNIPPLIYGGGMINFVFENDFTLKEKYSKFEAGSPNVAGVYGLTEAIKYMKKLDMENIKKYIKELTEYAYKKMSEIEEIIIYSPKNSNSIISFNIQGIHSHDISSILDEEKICLRAGHHCAMPFHKKMNANSSMRISFGIYNTKEEIDKLIEALKKAIKFFK